MWNLLKHYFKFQRAKSKHTWFTLHQLSRCRTTLFSHKLFEKLGQKMALFGGLLMRDCHSIAAQKLRRAFQLVLLYRRLYGDRYLLQVLDNFGNTINQTSKVKPLNFMFAALLFSWKEERISDKEIDRIVEDMNEIEHIQHLHLKDPAYMKSWEQVIDKEHLKLWRKPLPSSTYLYEYKVYGTFYDIPAKAFFHVQVDLEYRKQWDKNIIKLDVIDVDEDSGSEVVHWVTHFPRPMYSRDYVYVRRFKVDKKNNVMVLSSRAVEHPACPEEKTSVRVTSFESQMVIKPHSRFDENGLDYVLTYYDDPKAAYPSFAYNWMAKTGVPSFVDRIYRAAKEKHEQNHNVDNQSYTSSHSQHYC